MRVRKSANGVSVRLIAGTHVVLMGLDVTPARRKGLLGFALHRTDHTEDEAYWLEGMKTFEETDPGFGPGSRVSTREHPLQTFLWADYTAKPGHRYTYRAVALTGAPTVLKEAAVVEATVTTEDELGSTHSVWFNRGVAASQEYARRFQNRKPNEVGLPALRWLSRGLFEALTGFIARADGAKFALRAALYESEYPPVLEAFAQAAATGADVKVVYGAREAEEGPDNLAAIEKAGIQALALARSAAAGIPHNKFIVLLKDDRPVSVWTGSTNITLGGIFGHANCGHMVEDPTVAAEFLVYWQMLAEDTPRAALKAWTDDRSNLDEEPQRDQTLVLFSPRSRATVLERYAELAGNARQMVCMTAAFGVDINFVDAFDTEDSPSSPLRYLLLESRGRSDAQRANTQRLESRRSNRIAIGSKVVTNNLDRWLKERVSGFNGTVSQYVHLKFLLIDPLGDHPIVITGSANFSDESTLRNDENMLVVSGDTRVADIYLGEFMRLYSHHRFRQWLTEQEAEGEGSAAEAEPKHLVPNDTWTRAYFTPGWSQTRQRVVFV